MIKSIDKSESNLIHNKNTQSFISKVTNLPFFTVQHRVYSTL